MEPPIELDGATTIQCVDMHTTGEPARIIYRGYPEMIGTLHDQRAEAQRKHDRIRKYLMLEPRGHVDMYGALLRPQTELTATGAAHIGVLFLTGEGYSTMCGHATIALGRFLIDTHDKTVFPFRDSVPTDPSTNTATINLHAPCGLVVVTVPVTSDGHKSDPSRPVSFVSVPSFATGIDVSIPVPESLPGLKPAVESHHYTASIAYGGAFFLLPRLHSSRSHSDQINYLDLSTLSTSAFGLKTAFNSSPELLDKYCRVPGSSTLDKMFGTIITHPLSTKADPTRNIAGAELGMNFFGTDQFDRSPCGSGVAAREALAFAKGERKIGQRWAYHSVVSKAKGQGEMFGMVESECAIDGSEGKGAVRVRIEAKAFYSGFGSWVVEAADEVGRDGFGLKGVVDEINRAGL